MAKSTPMMHAREFFDLPSSLDFFASFFPSDEAPWCWIESIGRAMLAYGQLHKRKVGYSWLKPIRRIFRGHESFKVGKNVHIGKNVQLPVTYTIEDNVYIGSGTKICSGALIRQNVIIGENCVIGSACEIKNSLIMDDVRIAHFNYVGDSILGSHSHLAAGAMLANLRFDEKPVSVKMGAKKIPTGLRKFGAVLGEYAQVGCHSVLLPGTLLGKNSLVSVGTVFGGVLEANKVAYDHKILDRKE